jgi:hypothetical protein
MKIYFDDNRSAIFVEGVGYFLPKTLEAVDLGGRVVVKQVENALSELSADFASIKTTGGASAGATIGAVLDYLNAEFAKGAAANGGNLPEVTADPASTVVGQQWIQRRVIHPAGTLSALVGGFPVVLLTDQNAFALSIQTSEGVKRLELN